MEGIILYESSDNTLINNTANDNTGSGVILFCSSNNTLINNTAINNHVHGFYGLYGESICIKASSVQMPGEDWCKAENAIDGDIATRWSSQSSDPQFITVNFYSPQLINKLVLNWETAYAKEYKISVSGDGVNWKEVYYTNKGDGGTDEIFFNTVNTSHIMVNGTQRGTGWGYSLWELETSYSDEVLSIVGANASSVKSDAFKPENVFDGDIKTRWSSNFTDSEWIYADIGEVKIFNVVELNWETAYGKSYQIQISNDTENWTTVYSTQCSDGGIDLLYLSNQSVRYVMMKGVKRVTGWGYSLYEITIRNINGEPNMTVPIFIEKGYCPMWLLNEQTFWTTLGMADDEKEFILSEDGTIEPHKRNFTITPFLYINNTLITREDVIINQSLEKGYLPIPTVEWNYNNIVLNLTMFAYGNVSESIAYAWYKIKNKVDYNISGKLFLAVRPFQI